MHFNNNASGTKYIGETRGLANKPPGSKGAGFLGEAKLEAGRPRRTPVGAHASPVYCRIER